jgi:hypothetical protein
MVDDTDNTPFETTYYRLKINETGGNSQFSKTIAVHLGEAKTFKILSVSPNPTDNFLDIQFENPTTDMVTFTIFNTFGQLVFSEKVTALTTSTLLNTEGWSAGIYFLKIKAGQSVQTIRFLKN